MTSNFVDYVKILVRSGKGGAGSAHLLRVKYNAKAGPDGGDGGRGGHVMLRGNTNRWTLLHLKYTKHVFAENGQNGGQNLCTGREGEDQILDVPLGCVCRDAETGEQLCEITEEGQTAIIAKGGGKDAGEGLKALVYTTTEGISIPYGSFIGGIVDFLIVAFVVFLVMKKFLGFMQNMRKKEAEAPAAPAAPPEPSNEEKLLTEIRDLLKNK